MDHLAKSRCWYAMEGSRLACANNKFIRYARVSGWVQARSGLMQYPRCETPVRCRLSRAFYITVALSRHAFPSWCIRHHPHGRFFSLFPRRCTVGAILIVVLIWHFHAEQSYPPCSFICSIQSYSRFSLRAPMYFLLRYRFTPVIYISVIIGKVFYPELDENLFPSEVQRTLSLSLFLPLPHPSPFPPFHSFLSFTLAIYLFFCFSFSPLISSFVKLLYYNSVRHCRINLETDSRRATPTSPTAVTLSQYDVYPH